MRKTPRGFTLIEIMVVVTIIGILAAVVVPMYGDMVRKSKDASTKGNLGGIRSALSIYASDNEGQVPTDRLECLVVDQKYLKKIPIGVAHPHHPLTTTVNNTEDWGAAIGAVDTGDWMYFDDAALESPGSPQAGEVWLGCTHPDSTGRIWTVN